MKREAMFVKRHLLCVLLLMTVPLCSGCFEYDARPAPTVCGIYKFQTSDRSNHHGIDILILNGDSTYMHVYTHGSSGKDLAQSGTWDDFGRTIDLANFVAWDLSYEGVTYPDPAMTGYPLKRGMDGNYEIDANPDLGESFVQIDRFARCHDAPSK